VVALVGFGATRAHARAAGRAEQLANLQLPDSPHAATDRPKDGGPAVGNPSPKPWGRRAWHAAARCIAMPRRRAAKAKVNVKTRTRKPLRFHQREIERAIRGIKRMGLPVGRIEVDPVSGKFAIVTTEQTGTALHNPWDDDDAQNEKRSA
jgi:hypothetical protein